MDSLLPFLLPVKGLGDGPHEFRWTLDDQFFQAFEDSPLEQAQIELILELDKRPDLLVFEFSFAGYVVTECDRCLAPIQLPMTGQNRLVVKYSREDKESDDADVIYIHPETDKLNIAPFAYEYALLALPIIKVYDCEAEEEPPCDEEMLKYLDAQENGESDAPADNPFRDALKDWNKSE